MKSINDDLLNIIKDGEGVTTEFKTATNKLPKNLFETICAFLNRNGGHIFLGVGDNGEIIGVSKEDITNIKKEFTNLCNNPEKIDPTVYLNIDDYEIDGKVILYIYVYESSSVHKTKGKIYDRSEDGDYEIRETLRISEMYIRKQNLYTENRVFPYATMDDLRPDLIQRARQMAINNSDGRYALEGEEAYNNRKEHIWAHLNDEELLKSANLYERDLVTGKEGLTLAAILLFGKDETILNVLPHHKTDAIYRVKNLDRYDDRDDIRTNLLDSYDRLMAFVDKHLDNRFYVEGVQRVDVRNKIAREVIANMLIHREFSSPYPAKLIIEEYFMRTENANRAKRIGTLDISDFEPCPKNPKIARVFKEIGYADELGSGFRNIVKYTKLYSGGTPELKEDDVFKTVIPLGKEKSIENMDDDLVENRTSTDQVPTKYRPSTDQVPTKLDDDYKRIIEFCKTERSAREIREMMNLSHKQNFRNNYLMPLLASGRLQMVIPDRPNSSKQKYIAK